MSGYSLQEGKIYCDGRLQEPQDLLFLVTELSKTEDRNAVLAAELKGKIKEMDELYKLQNDLKTTVKTLSRLITAGES